MRVFVVMANDYPDRVFALETLASRYVADRMAEQRGNARIFYRHYAFEVQGAPVDPG